MSGFSVFFRESIYPLYINSEIAERRSHVALNFSSPAVLFESLHNKYQPFYILLTWYAIATLVYLIIGAVFALIEQMGWFYKYKITKEIKTYEEYKRCMLNLMLNIFIVIPPMLLSGWPVLKSIFDITAPVASFPTPATVIVHIVLCLYIEDLLHYILHRILHQGRLYKIIHKRHHEFEVPMALSGNYASPLETMILSLATFGPMVIIPNFSLFTFYVWVVVRWIDAAFEHCGYDIMPHYLPFHGGVTFHDTHHATFNYNYGSRFTYLDRWLGTYKDPTTVNRDKPKPKRQ